MLAVNVQEMEERFTVELINIGITRIDPTDQMFNRVCVICFKIYVLLDKELPALV